MRAGEAGFSLMEALISVLVLSIGLLGLGQLQAGLWKSAGQLDAARSAWLVSQDHLARSLWEADVGVAQPAEQTLETRLPGLTLSSRLRFEQQGVLGGVEVATSWQDTAGRHGLRLGSRVYAVDAADSRWLPGVAR
jgi:hypothetical protein